jgi:hypothetical protein
VGKKLPREQVNAESIGMMTFRGDGPRLFREAMDRALRRRRALAVVPVADRRARKTGVVFTQEISATGWTGGRQPRGSRKGGDAERRLAG